MNNDLATYSKGDIYDPQTCAPFTGNLILPGRLNTAAVNYLDEEPQPTRTDRVIENYVVQQRAANNYKTFDTCLD
jgi:hypothetical protein